MYGRLSSCICRVGVAGGGCRYWGGVIWKGSAAAGGKGDEQESGRWWRWDRDVHLRGNRALAAGSGVEYWCNVYTRRCTGYRTGCTCLASLMFTDYCVREARQVISDRSPADVSPQDTSPPLKLISGQKPTRVGRFNQWSWKYCSCSVGFRLNTTLHLIEQSLKNIFSPIWFLFKRKKVEAWLHQMGVRCWNWQRDVSTVVLYDAEHDTDRQSLPSCVMLNVTMGQTQSSCVTLNMTQRGKHCNLVW